MTSHAALFSNPEFVADLQGDTVAPVLAAKWQTGTTFIKDHRRKARAGIPMPSATKPKESDWEAGIIFDLNTGIPTEIRTPPMDEIVGEDYDRILEVMNVRLPSGYELRLANLFYNKNAWTRDTVGQEFAVTRPNVRYHFKVVQVSPEGTTPDDIDAAVKRVQSWKLPRRTPGTGLGEPIAAVLNLSDMQLFKSEGGGFEATEKRLYDGLENFQAYVDRQRKGGRNVDELVIVNNGDPYEGIAGNYASQLHTVQGGLRKQMNGVLDIWSAYSRELFPQFDKGQFVSVLCNHGELGRLGSNKNQTSDSDNGSAFLAETLERILSGRGEFDHIKWTIPHDEMNVYTDIAGVPTGLNHGHKIPGSDAAGFEKWLNGQVRGDVRAFAARIWITAHRHNFQCFDLGSATVFQNPSCDGGSKWLKDMTGRYSNSGILAMLVGNHERLGWSDPAFL